MRRRTSVSVLILILLVGFVALAPRTPPGRAWLLGKVKGALDGAGVRVSWDASSGSMWGGVRLEGARVRADGADVRVRSLGLRYFLPSLLAGELPLSIEADGVRGELDLRRLGAPAGGGGGAPLSPTLRDLRVSDARLTLAGVPYSLPDGSIESLSAHRQEDGVELSATVRTRDGSADIEGTVGLAAGTFDGHVNRADATLARHWFDGAVDGTVSGPLHVGADGVTGDFRLEGGAVDALGLDPRAIHGEVRLRYPLITADVYGTTLGGEVHATGTVNVAARRWQATADGHADLAAAAAWLARGALGPDPTLPLSGDADVTVDAQGWSQVTLSGRARGTGRAAGVPLDGLDAAFSLDPERGLRVTAGGRLGGGPLELTAASTPAGLRVQAAAPRVTLAAGALLSASLDVRAAPDGPTGGLRAALDADALGQPVRLVLEGKVDQDGWQGFVSGTALGAPIEGALVLAGGRLNGELRADGARIPGLEQPLGVRLGADGPPGRLPMTLRVTGSAPLRLGGGAVSLAAGPVGALDATLVGASLEDVRGALGPLSVAGRLELAPLQARLRLDLAPTGVTAGPAHGTLALSDVTLGLDGAGAAPQGTLRLTAASVGPVELPALTLPWSARLGATPGFDLGGPDQALELHLDDGRMAARLRELGLRISGVSATVDGRLAVPLRAGAGAQDVDPDLTLRAAGASATLRRAGGQLVADLALDAGSRIGPLALAEEVRVGATVDPGSGRTVAVGHVGSVPLRLTASYEGGGWSADAAVGAAPSLDLRLRDGSWSARGPLDLGGVGRAVGLPLTGRLEADLDGASLREVRGSAALRLERPLPAVATIEGTPDGVHLSAQSGSGALALTAEGRVAPGPDLLLRLGPLGPMRFADGRLTGEGRTDSLALAAGITLEPQPWTIDGSWGERRVDLALGDGGGALRLDLAGAPMVAASLALPLRFRGRMATLHLATAGAPPAAPGVDAPWAPADDLAALPVSARLDLGGTQGDVGLEGTLGTLRVTGSVSAAELGANVPQLPELAGSLALDGEVHVVPSAAARDAPSAGVDARWSDGDRALLRARVAASPGRWQASASGSGLDLELTPERVTLTADHAAVAPLFRSLAPAPTLDGTLQHGPGGWLGGLRIALPAPIAATATLSGDGGELGLRAEGTAYGATVDVRGPLTPAPDLRAAVTALAGRLAADLRLDGSWGAPELHGTLHADAWTPAAVLALPAVDATVSWTPGDGGLALTGEGIDVHGSLQALDGRLSLPLELWHGPATATLDVHGAAGDPALTLTLEGDGTQVTAAGSPSQGWKVRGSLEPGVVSDATPLPTGLFGAPVTLTGSVGTDAAWSLTASTTLATGAAPQALQASLQGTGTRYLGSVALGGPDAIARLSVDGDGTRARAVADLGDVAWGPLGDWLGVPMTLDARGSLTLETRPAAASIDIAADGTVAGVAVRLRGGASSDGAVALEGAVAGVELGLHGEAGGAIAVRAATPDGGTRLDGSAAFGGRPTLSLEGTAEGHPASLEVAYTPAERRGTLRAGWEDAQLEADVAPDAAGTLLTVHLEAPPDGIPLAPPGYGLEADARLRASGGVVTLDDAGFRVRTPFAAADLHASGALTPDASIAATLSTPLWPRPIGMDIRGGVRAWTLLADLGDARVRAEMSGASPAALDLTGSLRWDRGDTRLALTSEGLGWAREDGFRGHARGEISAAGLPGGGAVRLQLDGQGTLEAGASLGPVAAPWATAHATIARDPLRDRGLQGDVTLSVPQGSAPGIAVLAPLGVDGRLALSGAWSAPEVRGPVTLSGPAPARGSLAWTPAGGSIDLEGERLTLGATLEGGSWSGHMDLREVPLEAWAAGLADARLSLTADAAGTAGALTQARLTSLDLNGPGVRVTGDGLLGPQVRVALEIDGDLAALPLQGAALRGRVRGPVALSAPDLARLREGSISAVLDVAGVGTQGLDGGLSGSLQLSGSPVRPIVSADLSGIGAVRGSLRLDLDVAAGRLTLASDLAMGAVQSDVRASVADGRAVASGSLRYGNAAVVLSSATGGGIALDGAGRVDGWHALVAADLSSATIRGDLATLGPGVLGALALTVGSSPWLDGAVEDAAVAGAPLGTVRFASASPGDPVTITGTSLQGTLDPLSRRWSLSLEAQPLPAGLSVSGDASGQGAEGDARLTLDGTLAGAPVAVTVSGSAGARDRLQLGGALLGGRLEGAAELRDGSWAGSLSLSGATLAGETVTLDGTVLGVSADPRWVAEVRAEGAAEARGRLVLSRTSASTDLTLRSAALGGPLRISGGVLPDLDLRVSPAAASAAGGDSLRLYQAGGRLRADGALPLTVGPASLTLAGRGRGAPPALVLTAGALPGARFSATLPDAAPLAALTAAARDGLSFRGGGSAEGTLAVHLSPGLRVDAQGVGLSLGGVRLRADGSYAAGGGTLQGTLGLPAAGWLAGLTSDTSVPFSLDVQGTRLALQSRSDLGTVDAEVDLRRGSGTANAHLALPGDSGGAVIDVLFTPGAGASGRVTLSGIGIERPGLPHFTLSGDVQVNGGRANGEAELRSGTSGLRLTGDWGLGGVLPDALAPNAPRGGDAELRVSTLDPSILPPIARLAPHLGGSVSGVLQLRGRRLLGQLVAPELSVADTALPADLQLSGTLGDVSARLTLAGSLVTATLTPGRASGLMRFERFPAQVLAEAATGATDVQADLTGVLRFDVPYARPASGYLRLATEEVRLERAGVTTTGSVALSYDDGALTVEQASFAGRGTWRAEGVVNADTLQFSLRAEEADFGPLLGLVPALVRYGVGADGSFSLDATGTLADPQVQLESGGLDAQVAGTRYRIERAALRLSGTALTGSARVAGVAPLGGALDATASARLQLAPVALDNVDVRVSGSVDVPVVGTITGVSGGITQGTGEPPTLALKGTLGRPFRVVGSLAPLDLSIKGSGLDLRAAPLFITGSTVDSDVRLVGGRDGVHISGDLLASEIRLDLGARNAGGQAADTAGGAAGADGGPAQPAPAPGGASPAPTPGATAETAAGAATASIDSGAPTASVDTGAPAASGDTGAPTAPGAAGAAAASRRTGRAALAAVHFDGLRVRAPQRVLLNASVASAEASLDLSLTGTAAEPRLDGVAEALRGNVRFGGRDFTLDRAVATFQANRGAYPALDVEAHTTFEKARVLSGVSGVRFVAPTDKSTFDVVLAFSGQVQPPRKATQVVTFDITPTLSSDARIETEGSGQLTAGARALTDAELLSLVTLGRLELRAQIAGQAGFGTAVAQSALDTAIDVLVVSELQNALSKALGLDVVEIRTTSLGSLLENGDQPFGVSLRLGGYLTPDLFASYRLGTLDDRGQGYAFTNEVSVVYDLGPLALDISGRLSFPDATTLAGPQPELGVGLRYAFTDSLGLETGLDLSSERQQARFGVTLRW